MAEALAPIRPPLKWAGGKRWLRPVLAELWRGHEHRRLVEPFCGGLAVVLGLRPLHAHLNDINPHTCNFYRQLQRGLEPAIEMRNDRTLYFAHRDRFNELIGQGRIDTPLAAALFYFLNRTGFNGLCRFNRKGLFNVPFGRYKTIKYRTDFSEFREALAGWVFTCGDFESLELEAEDFVYADPPYDVQFKDYAAAGFSFEDQERLAHWLAAHPGPVVASNQATPRMLALYRDLGFEVRELHGPRNISRTGDRTPALELLATRNLPRAAKV